MLLEHARTEITAACQSLAPDRLIVGTAGNLSIREGDLVAITPSGLPPSTCSPDS